MVFELSEKYVPDNFLFREKQKKAIESVFKNYKKFGFGAGGNKLVIGSTGVGKTALTTKILSENNSSMFVSARIHNTANKILKALLGETKKADTSDLINKLNHILIEDGKVVVIDEIDKCSNVCELGRIMDTIFRECGTPFVIISNNWNILNMLPDDAQKSLAFSRVEFPSYSAIELGEILSTRLELVEKKYPDLPKFSYSSENFDEEGIRNLLASRIVRVFNSSVRMLLNITLSCIVNNNFSPEFMEEEIQKKNKDEWAGNLMELGQTEKEFLWHLFELSEGEDKVLSSEIHKQMPDLSSARISQVTKSLFNAGVIEIKSVSSGKVGNRFRAVEFSCDDVKKTIGQVLRPWDNSE